MSLGDTVLWWSTVGGGAAAVVGLPVAWYYGHRSTKPEAQVPPMRATEADTPQPREPQIVLRVYNAIPTYDLPDGGMTAEGHFVAVDVANNGERTVTVMGWGVKLPGDRRVVVYRPVNWSTRLPHRLEPGAEPARLVIPADELFQLEREQGIAFTDMIPYVTLADGTELTADGGVPLKRDADTAV